MSQVGTPLYMSPETLQGQGHELVSDIWSLGCVLYELAMLTSPFYAQHLTMDKVGNFCERENSLDICFFCLMFSLFPAPTRSLYMEGLVCFLGDSFLRR